MGACLRQVVAGVLAIAAAAELRAQTMTDAISREFTVYVDTSSYPPITDASSREFTVYVGTQPLRVQTDAVSREFTVFLDAAAATGITDAISREFTVYHGTQPLRVQTDAVSREFTVFFDSAASAGITDAISREFTVYHGSQPLRPQVDAITREFTVFVGEFEKCLFDLNVDGIVNAADFQLVAACLNGPGISNTGCNQAHFNRADFDNDGDFDLPDFARFQAAIGAICQ